MTDKNIFHTFITSGSCKELRRWLKLAVVYESNNYYVIIAQLTIAVCRYHSLNTYCQHTGISELFLASEARINL